MMQFMLQEMAKYCNIQNGAARCGKILQDGARCCTMLRDMYSKMRKMLQDSVYCKILKNAARCWKQLQDAATYCKTLQDAGRTNSA